MSEASTPRPLPPPGSVDLWRIVLERTVAAADDLALLPPAEQARAARLISPRDGAEFAQSHAGLRRILAAYAGGAPEALVLEEGDGGKPRLAASPSSSAAGLRFNLSHTRGLALVAVAAGVEVGIDVEAIRLVERELPERFFSTAERRDLAGLDGDTWRTTFFRCWTRKEAVLKAHGAGLRLPLDSFDVTCLPGDPVRVRRAAGPLRTATGWTLLDLEVGPGFAGALAIAASGVWLAREHTDAPPGLAPARASAVGAISSS